MSRQTAAQLAGDIADQLKQRTQQLLPRAMTVEVYHVDPLRIELRVQTGQDRFETYHLTLSEPKKARG